MESILTPQAVEELFVACLDDEGEQSQKVDGIVHSVYFNKEVLELKRDDIKRLLTELPTEFTSQGGGGWSFLNACNDKNGNQWTGDHFTMEKLFLLGLGTEQVKYLMPKELWSVLPGGMPYYIVIND